MINIFQPPIAGSLVLCFSIAAILYGLFYAILKTKPNEFEKDRGVFRIGEWRSFFRNRKLLSENCSNLKKEIDYKRWLHARLVLAVHKVEEVADLLAVNLQTLSGIQFEQYLEKVFGVLGYPEVIRTIASGDQGIDLIIGDGRERIAIQAKLYQTSVGNEAVQQAFAGMAHYQCDRCAVITNSIFTKSAFMLSKSTGCKLIDGQLLRQIIAGKERL